MELPEKLKEIIREKSKKEIKDWVRCAEGDYFAVAELIISYLKEFKNVKTEEGFKKEAMLIWHNSHPINFQHPIKDAVNQMTSGLETQTGKILYTASYACWDVGVVKYIAQMFYITPGIWEIVQSIFNEGE